MFTHTEVTLSWNTWKNVCTRTNAARSSLLSPYTVAPSSFDRWGALRLPITITYGILSVFTAPCIWHPAQIYYRLRIAGYILTTRASDVIERNGARGAATGCVGTKCEWTRSSGNEMPHSIRGQQWRVCMRAPLRAVAAVCVSGRHMAFTGCARATPSNDMHRTIAMGEKTSNLFIFVYSMRKRVLDLSVHNLLELLILWMCLLGTYLVCCQSSLKLSTDVFII